MNDTIYSSKLIILVCVPTQILTQVNGKELLVHLMGCWLAVGVGATLMGGGGARGHMGNYQSQVTSVQRRSTQT